MRPVNLIPADERRGDRAAMRTGSFSYVLLGALAVAVLAVAVLALTSKQISDRETEVAQLQQQEAVATAKAQSLTPFIDFRAAQESRAGTITSLAQSRFDWQRVLNELARVLPTNVWLTQLGGTANPSVALSNGPSLTSRDSVQGPALEIVGCTVGQDAVAALVSRLQEIDGVTRVGVQSSERSDESGAVSDSSTGSDSSGGQVTECRTRDFITKFEIVVAFDEVPAPSTATATPSLPPGVPPTDGSQLTSSASAGTGG
jgi:Tfp pilus assembly protein PilN